MAECGGSFDFFQFTFPNHQYFPPVFLQCFDCFGIIGFVGIDFIRPPLRSCFGYGKIVIVAERDENFQLFCTHVHA
jgi:hypothetical protein